MKIKDLRMKNNEWKLVLLTWGILTLILLPWKNSLSQDDGTYAWQALQWSQYSWSVHPANVAAVIPQTFLGAIAVSLFSFLKPIIVLNLLTWSLFLLILGLTATWTGSSLIFLISIFSYPLWIQYSASFLYEIYSSALILGLLLSIDQKESKFQWLLVSLFSFLIPLQVQTTSIIPVSLGLFYFIFLPIRRKLALSLILCPMIGLITYYLLPQSILQQTLLLTIGAREFQLKTFSFFFLQLLLGFGSLLLPFMRNFKNWSLRLWISSLFLFLTSYALLYFSDAPILSIGVLFTQYMPRSIAILPIAIGAFGLVGCTPIMMRALNDSIKRVDTLAFLVSMCGFFAFYSLKGINDFRIAMIFVIFFIFSIRPFLQLESKLGESKLFTASLLALSLFVNSYNLDTTEARWKLAASLEKEGKSPAEISAGYGRDVFNLEATCIDRAQQKLDSNSFSHFLFFNVPRCYNYEWTPKYLIKPHKIFGKTLSLQLNRQPGQDQAPQKIYPYRSLGLQHELAVFENPHPTFSWCLR